MTTKAIGYIRVSTEEQAKEGVSLAAQAEKLTAYAALYDIELVDIIEDAGVSAKSLKRPGLQQALDRLGTDGINALLIHKLDRLTRSVRDLGGLLDTYFGDGRLHYELLSVTDMIDTRSAAGRLTLNVLMSVSQWEREAISERTRDGLRYMRQQRRVYNHEPLGFRAADGRLTPDDEEQMIVAEIFDLHSQGNSLRAIAGSLNGRGITGKRGGIFYASTVRAILGNELHAAA
jgi:site-specific DNA recombinase